MLGILFACFDLHFDLFEDFAIMADALNFRFWYKSDFALSAFEDLLWTS